MYNNNEKSAPAATTGAQPAYYNAQKQNNAGKKNNMLTRQESQAEIEAVILHKILTRSESEITPKLINFLDQEDFTLPFHRQLFGILKKLSKTDKEIDVYSVAQEMGMESPYIINNLLDLATMDVFVFDSTIIDLAKKLKERKLKKRISYLKLEEIKEEIEKIEEIDREDDLFVDFQEEEIKEEKFLLTLREDPKSGWPLATSALLAARGGVGKSHLAVQLACCLALQEEILFLVPQKRVKSLIFNFEDDNGHDTARMLVTMSKYVAEKHSATEAENEILGYLKEDVLIAGAGLKRLLKDCFVQKWGRDVKLNPEKINKIIDICKKHEIELVIIDAIVHLVNAKDHARTYMDFCSKFNQAGINVLNLSHLNKNSKITSDDEKVYGGVELVNLHRFVTLLDYQKKDGYYTLQILKGNKVKHQYIYKEYLCVRNSIYWQILESAEDYSTKKAKSKNRRGRK